MRGMNGDNKDGLRDGPANATIRVAYQALLDARAALYDARRPMGDLEAADAIDSARDDVAEAECIIRLAGDVHETPQGRALIVMVGALVGRVGRTYFMFRSEGAIARDCYRELALTTGYLEAVLDACYNWEA